MIDKILDWLIEWPTSEFIETYLWLCLITLGIGYDIGFIVHQIHH